MADFERFPIKPMRGKRENIQNGFNYAEMNEIIVAVDYGEMYVCDGHNHGTKIGDIIPLNLDSERVALTSPLDGKFYYIIDTNTLWFYYTDWINLNETQEELQRQANEQLRVSAEYQRINNESGRNSAETTRQQMISNLIYVGTYDNTVQYYKNNIISYESYGYIALQSSKNNPPTIAGSNAYWGLLAGKGIGIKWIDESYDSTKTYYPNDALYYLGSTYRCIQESLNHPPTDSVYWKILAQKGADGAGTGDMQTSLYDSNGDGKVNAADNSDKVGGKTASGTLATTEKNDLVSAINEVFQSASSGKTLLETTITGMGGTVSKVGTVATFNELSNGIESITTGIDTTDATATANDIISPKTAYVNGEKIIGNIINQGLVTITPSTTNQTKPAGYYSGITVGGDTDLITSNIKSGVNIFGVAGKTDVVDTMESTNPASANNIENGKVAFVNGSKVTGNLVNNGVQTIIPQTTDTAISGIYANGSVVKGEPNLSSENIRDGISIFGVIGSLTGKKFATGEIVSIENGTNDYVLVTGLDFTPKVVTVLCNPGVNDYISHYNTYLINKVMVQLGATNENIYDVTYNAESTYAWYKDDGSFRIKVACAPKTCLWFACE